jgi:hypothetical protein
MEPMATKFSRRLVISLLGPIGAIIAFGSAAQEASQIAPPRNPKVDIVIPRGSVPFVGPITAPMTKISADETNSLIARNGTTNSSRLSNQIENVSVQNPESRTRQ